jgi:DNA-binding response OmpR family regulator
VEATDSATIVVVEQSAAVQDLIDQVLRAAGHRVLITQNPLEALDVARRVRIDLLVTEVFVSDAQPSLAELIRSTHPDLRVLYTSAGAETNSGPDDGDLTLRAPFSLAELQEAVTASLERASDRAGKAP